MHRLFAASALTLALSVPLAASAQSSGAAPAAAVDAFHAREADIRAKVASGVDHRSVGYKSGDHAMIELKRMDNDEAQWERRQGGKLYPNQLAALESRLTEIRRWLDQQQPHPTH